MTKFEKLPVQHNGRIKPINTLANNTLLIISGKQTLKLPNNAKINATTWLLDTIARPEVANDYKVFRIDNPEVLGLFGWEQNHKFFSYHDLEPHLETIVKQADAINKEDSLRSTFETQINKLYQSLVLYNQLVASFSTGTHPGTQNFEFATWLSSIPSGMEAIRNQAEGKPFDSEALNRFAVMADHYLELSKLSPIGIIPSDSTWTNLGQGMLDTLIHKEINPIILNYNDLISAYRNLDPTAFNTALKKFNYQNATSFEVFFNNAQPFYTASVLYLLTFLTVCLTWLWGSSTLKNTASKLLLLAFLIHTFGLIARMIITHRPPVTNLYSSAIFVGWGSVLLGLTLERFNKQGLGLAVASLIGFSTLIIAHNLGLSGDTLEALRAVLDSNFWLSTHVIVITLGYSAMFLAGIIAIFYILGNLKKHGLDPKTNKNLLSMAYGILAFATLFSFTGTMLGGIWADQSWGRFWGWDPKENGALLIVLWCAITLHAKWGKIVHNQGFMALLVIGNIITSWSWFGTNMLGVGLHSYGFIDKAFYALMIFITSQLLIIIISAFSRNKN